jgi:enoyl-CoA hydratase/carnithine racemase
MMFTGRKLTVAEAQAAGLVSRVVEAAALDSVVADIAKTILAAPQAALRQAKSCIDQGMALDLRGGLELERAAMEENVASGTWRAGMSPGAGKH